MIKLCRNCFSFVVAWAAVPEERLEGGCVWEQFDLNFLHHHLLESSYTTDWKNNWKVISIAILLSPSFQFLRHFIEKPFR